ncbi:MAG TPA: sugar phosphate nucleotidyltransferase [Gammaproteobacteria bacterium]
MSITQDLASRTVAIVLAGGKGTRLDPLTRNVCKPALPFGGTFRCVDFSLSNCVNSGIRTIGVATQYKPDALLDHLWSHWNSAAIGNAALVHAWRAEERAARFGYCGTADAVYRNLASIRGLERSLVLVLAGDHVYKMDYRPMLEAHRARDAAVTIGCVHAPVEQARHFGVLAVGEDGRIERFVEKPRSLAEVPQADGSEVLASMGIYVFDGALLAQILHIDAAQPDSGHDFGADILPRLIEGGCAYSYAFRGCGTAPAYWRDIGTLDAYWRAHMELLGPRPLMSLDDPRWPIGRIATAAGTVRASSSATGGTIEDSLVPAGCSIGGQVVRSVLSDGVGVARGAKVSESVVLPGAFVGAGSRLQGVIVDSGYRVPEGTVIERYAGLGEPPVLSVHLDQAARYAAAR